MTDRRGGSRPAADRDGYSTDPRLNFLSPMRVLFVVRSAPPNPHADHRCDRANTFPQAVHDEGGTCGTHLNFPAVAGERNNSNFLGCTDRLT